MEKNVHEITVVIDKEEWAKALDKAYKKKNKEVKIDGFRKGAAPKDIFIKKFGIESLYMDAVDQVVDPAYKKALDEAKITPVIEPKLDIKSVTEEAVTFVFTLIERPEVKLGDYKNLGIKKESPKVTKKEIEEEIKNLRDKLAEITLKEGGKIEDGDTAVIDFKGFVDGKPLEGGTGENYPLQIGSHTFIPGFEEGLVGLKSGDEKTLELTFPEDYVEDLKGKKVKFEVKINEIKTRALPELNEDFYKDLGYEDMKTKEELEEEVKKTISLKKEEELDDKYTEECLDKAVSNMTVSLNKEIVDDEIHHMIHQFEQRLASQGLNIEQYYQFSGMTHEKLHEQMHDEAEKRVKYRYLIEAVSEKENISVTDEETEAKAKEMSENYGISKDELIKAYGSLEVIKYDIKMHKALEIIKG